MPKLARGKGRSAPARPRGRPSPDEAAQIDREILNAAVKLFFTQGYERTSMAMIIKAAGVSKTTLYARHTTKSDLFKATVALTIERVEAEFMKLLGEPLDDLAEGLIHFGYHAIMISIAPLWSNYERLVFAEGPRFPELTGAIANRIDVGIEVASEMIVAGAARDGIACRDPHAVATTYIMALRGYHTAAVLRASVPGEAECRAFVTQLVTALLASRETW